jgi:hypothetical protein
MQLDLGHQRPYAVAAKSAAGVVSAVNLAHETICGPSSKSRRARVSVHLKRGGLSDWMRQINKIRVHDPFVGEGKVAGFD